MDKSAEEWEADIKRYAELRDEATRVGNWQDAAWWNSKRADAARAWVRTRDRKREMKENGLTLSNNSEGDATMYIILSRKYGSAVMNRGSIRIFDTNKEAEQWIKDYCEYPRDAYVIFELTERESIL